MLNTLFSFDARLRKKDIKYIAGIDESGRGPLAGPVVAAAVVLPADFYIANLNDVKMLNEGERKKMYFLIKSSAIAIATGIISAEIIDSINIFQATYKAMAIAVKKLSVKVDLLLVDGPFKIPLIEIPQKAIVRGDCTSASIACASIIAKVTRDRIMSRLHKQYPQYGFSVHKGYPTPEHLRVLSLYGPSKVHRYSFGPVKSIKSVRV